MLSIFLIVGCSNNSTMMVSPTARPWRRFLRFSVRGLIVAVLAIGGSLGWMVHCARIQREAVAAIERVGGTIRYNWESKNGKLISKRKPNAPGFLVDFVGADFFGHVTDVKLSAIATDAILVHVGRLSRLKRLDISGPWLNRSNPVPNRSQSQEFTTPDRAAPSPIVPWRQFANGCTTTGRH
jgi:hypothetical protein